MVCNEVNTVFAFTFHICIVKENGVLIQIENKVHKKISIHLALRTLCKSVTFSKVFLTDSMTVTSVYV